MDSSTPVRMRDVIKGADEQIGGEVVYQTVQILQWWQ